MIQWALNRGVVSRGVVRIGYGAVEFGEAFSVEQVVAVPLHGVARGLVPAQAETL